VALAWLLAMGCAAERKPTPTWRVQPGRTTTASPAPATDYISREAADMAAEDQERSAQSPGCRPQPPYRERPIHPPSRSLKR
jgi:hypothetical protein